MKRLIGLILCVLAVGLVACSNDSFSITGPTTSYEDLPSLKNHNSNPPAGVSQDETVVDGQTTK